jgi:ankyrin repeat protein
MIGLEEGLSLIKTGQSKPEHIDSLGNTALIYACQNSYMNDELAIKLIDTGLSRPEHIDDLGCTALMYACHFKRTNVAIALINTGQSNPEHLDIHNRSALDIAMGKNMDEVVNLLRNNRRIQQEDRRTRQESINERVRQSAQRHVEIDTPYEECIICSELLDNINGPGESEKCSENCNDVVKICENNHMIHRGCILNACNANKVNIASQMGFSQFNTLAKQKRKNQCPICQVSLLVPCEEFKTVDKVLETDLPKKTVGGRRNKKTTKNKKTKRRYKRIGKKTKKSIK